MIQRGRFTHDQAVAGDGMVVFLIGMRVNAWWRVTAWLPVAMAMGPMLTELSRDKGHGLLGFRTLLGNRGPTVVQYWRDVDALYAYAGNRDASHHPAWMAFMKRAAKANGAVGIWHETFPVRAAESVYVDMPVTGLPAVTGPVPVTRRTDRARDRLGLRG
jgi:hypothetical protein